MAVCGNVLKCSYRTVFVTYRAICVHSAIYHCLSLALSLQLSQIIFCDLHSSNCALLCCECMHMVSRGVQGPSNSLSLLQGSTATVDAFFNICTAGSLHFTVTISPSPRKLTVKNLFFNSLRVAIP